MYFIYVMIGLEESRVRLNLFLCLCPGAIYHFFVISFYHININILNRVDSLYCPPKKIAKNSQK